MLFVHDNRYMYLPLTGLLTLLQRTIQPHRKIFEIFQKYFTKYFMKYFTPKNFMKFYITSCKLLESNFAITLLSPDDHRSRHCS